MWKENENIWAWQYTTEEETHDLDICEGEKIRFAITKEVFKDIAVDVNKGVEETAQNVAPYMLYAQISESGLGLISWWD